jgi:hypothetical protein
VPGAWRSGALLRHARTAVVVASGGRALWDAFARAPEFGSEPDPLDAYTRRAVEAATAELGPAADTRALYAFEKRGGDFADFVALGRLAGLGAQSRLGLLLHPTYGPWLSLRAIVLTREEWEPRTPIAFDPCPSCPAPCAAAPSYAAARSACLVGPAHAYSEAALAHHLRHARSS